MKMMVLVRCVHKRTKKREIRDRIKEVSQKYVRIVMNWTKKIKENIYKSYKVSTCKYYSDYRIKLFLSIVL